VLGAEAYAALTCAFGGGEDGAALAEWAFLTRCAAQQSTCGRTCLDACVACALMLRPPPPLHTRSCDALAISNSTFSFSAAMLASAAAAPESHHRCSRSGGDANGSGRAAFRAVRPDPVQRTLVPFDPWDALPTLKRGGA
jgi:hypothetical protein